MKKPSKILLLFFYLSVVRLQGETTTSDPAATNDTTATDTTNKDTTQNDTANTDTSNNTAIDTGAMETFCIEGCLKCKNQKCVFCDFTKGYGLRSDGYCEKKDI